MTIDHDDILAGCDHGSDRDDHKSDEESDADKSDIGSENDADGSDNESDFYANESDFDGRYIAEGCVEQRERGEAGRT